MKPKSISGLVCHVQDLAKTKQFYETLGFRFGSQDTDRLVAYINWFWIEFYPGAPKVDSDKSGPAIQIAVESVDESYKYVKAEGLRPVDEPHDGPQGRGRREFTLADPDGYRLVLFQK